MHLNYDVLTGVAEVNADVWDLVVAVDKAVDNEDTAAHNRVVALLVSQLMTMGLPFVRCADLMIRITTKDDKGIN